MSKSKHCMHATEPQAVCYSYLVCVLAFRQACAATALPVPLACSLQKNSGPGAALLQQVSPVLQPCTLTPNILCRGSWTSWRGSWCR